MQEICYIGKLIAFHTNFDRTNTILGSVVESRKEIVKNLFGFKKEKIEYRIVWHDSDRDDTWVEIEGIKRGLSILQEKLNLENKGN
jgi:hypothetical protein